MSKCLEVDGRSCRAENTEAGHVHKHRNVGKSKISIVSEEIAFDKC